MASMTSNIPLPLVASISRPSHCYSTGHPRLDVILGGGLPSGCISELVLTPPVTVMTSNDQSSASDRTSLQYTGYTGPTLAAGHNDIRAMMCLRAACLCAARGGRAALVDTRNAIDRHVLLEALRYVTHAAAGPSGTALPMRTEEESIDSIAIVKAFDVFALLRSLQSLVDAGASDPTRQGVLFDLLVIDSLEAVFAPLVFSAGETQRHPRSVLGSTRSSSLATATTATRDHSEGPPLKAPRVPEAASLHVTDLDAQASGVRHSSAPILVEGSRPSCTSIPLPMGGVCAAASAWAETLGAQTAALLRALLAPPSNIDIVMSSSGDAHPFAPIIGAILVTSSSSSVLGGLSGGPLRRISSSAVAGGGGGVSEEAANKIIDRSIANSLVGLSEIADVSMYLRAAVLPPAWSRAEDGTASHSNSSNSSSTSGSNSPNHPYPGRFVGGSAVMLEASNSGASLTSGSRMSCPVIIELKKRPAWMN